MVKQQSHAVVECERARTKIDFVDELEHNAGQRQRDERAQHRKLQVTALVIIPTGKPQRQQCRHERCRHDSVIHQELYWHIYQRRAERQSVQRVKQWQVQDDNNQRDSQDQNP